MTITELYEPFLKSAPALLLAVTIIVGFITGWIVSKTTYRREIDAHTETKGLLKEALAGWKEQTKATEKANRLVQRVVDALRLRQVLGIEDDPST